MKFLYTFKTAIVGLKTNKVRSFLTMLGVIIGIAAVVSTMSLGAGAENLIVGQIMSMGSNNIFIEPGSFDPKEQSMMQSMTETMEIKTMKLSDAEAIEKLPTIKQTAPMVMGTGRVLHQGVDKKATFIGTTPAALKIDETKTILGREMTDLDVKSNARVALLGYQVSKDLFGDENPIGEKIRIQKTNFQVIGVLEEIGNQMFFSFDDIVYVPITTAQSFLLGGDHINQIIAQAESEEVLEEATENIRILLRERHNIYNPEGDPVKDDFKVMSQKEAADMLKMVTGIFTLFLSSVAAIALVVGGIGIMNIMLVSVTERTKEIGLRKALGAKKKDVLLQFLMEAITLTLVGGIIGIISGVILSFVGGLVLGRMLGSSWGFFISWEAIILGFGVASIVGLVFGIYPAKKASKLSPIEALRYE
jgi:putative ABC transport system permease protein